MIDTKLKEFRRGNKIARVMRSIGRQCLAIRTSKKITTHWLQNLAPFPMKGYASIETPIGKDYTIGSLLRYATNVGIEKIQIDLKTGKATII
jgi:hypothetical protein